LGYEKVEGAKEEQYCNWVVEETKQENRVNSVGAEADQAEHKWRNLEILKFGNKFMSRLGILVSQYQGSSIKLLTKFLII